MFRSPSVNNVKYLKMCLQFIKAKEMGTENVDVFRPK